MRADSIEAKLGYLADLDPYIKIVLSHGATAYNTPGLADEYDSVIEQIADVITSSKPQNNQY